MSKFRWGLIAIAAGLLCLTSAPADARPPAKGKTTQTAKSVKTKQQQQAKKKSESSTKKKAKGSSKKQAEKMQRTSTGTRSYNAEEYARSLQPGFRDGNVSTRASYLRNYGYNGRWGHGRYKSWR